MVTMRIKKSLIRKTQEKKLQIKKLIDRNLQMKITDNRYKNGDRNDVNNEGGWRRSGKRERSIRAWRGIEKRSWRGTERDRGNMFRNV